jgi:undecaprenyl-diphosphatase
MSAGPFGEGGVVAALDAAADDALESLRGNEILDRVMVTATHAGEFSMIWHACSVVRGLVKNRPDQIAAMAIGIGAESLIVNQGLKRAFRRTRPTEEGDERFGIRRPLTSSFPSGHASAAAFAATVFTGWDGRRSAPVWWSLAVTVALSRPYVRIHHASDVVAGAAVGAALGVIAGRSLRRLGLG